MNERSTYQRDYREQYKKRYKYLSVGFPMADFKRLEKVAAKYKKKVTPFVRDLALSSLDDKQVMPEQLIELLQEHNRLVRNMANNLNQIAHKTNIFHEVDKKMVFDHLRELDALVKGFVEKEAQGK